MPLGSMIEASNNSLYDFVGFINQPRLAMMPFHQRTLQKFCLSPIRKHRASME